MLENNIKNLIKILENSKVDELEISTFWGKQKIKIRKKFPSIFTNLSNNMMNYPDKRLISIDSPGARATFRYSILSFSIQ